MRTERTCGPLLQFDGAAFRYGRREPQVVENFDLTVPAGRTILLGPNGAGKSTLLALAASVLRLNRGAVSLDGVVPTGRAGMSRYRRRVAWMPQSVVAAAGLTAREQVALYGWLAGMERQEAWLRAHAALVQVDLASHADRQASQLSGGQRARMGLAQAVVRDADLVLLDEPTAALDPDQRRSFAELLSGLSVGRTVVVSSHDVSDLADSYDAVVVLDDGTVRYQGPTGDFLDRGGDDRSAVTAYRSVLGASR